MKWALGEWSELAGIPLLWLLMTSLPFASVRGNVNLLRNFGHQRARDLIFDFYYNRHLAILKPPPLGDHCGSLVLEHREVKETSSWESREVTVHASCLSCCLRVESRQTAKSRLRDPRLTCAVWRPKGSRYITLRTKAVMLHLTSTSC